MDLNNRRPGKDATKPRELGLLEHSDLAKKILTKNNSRWYFMKKLSWNHGRWIRRCKDF